MQSTHYIFCYQWIVYGVRGVPGDLAVYHVELDWKLAHAHALIKQWQAEAMLALEMLQKHEPVIPERAVLQVTKLNSSILWKADSYKKFYISFNLLCFIFVESMEAGLTGYPGLRVQ